MFFFIFKFKDGSKSDGVGYAPKCIDVDFKFKELKLYWTLAPPPVQGRVKMEIGAYFE